MARVLVTRRLPDGGLEPLARAGHELVQRDDDPPLTHDELVAAAADVDAIVCLLTDRIDRDGARSRCGRRPAAGRRERRGRLRQHRRRRRAPSSGSRCATRPACSTRRPPTSRSCSILAASRLAHDAEADLRGRTAGTGWGIIQYLGQDVHGATLGLVGFGRIGQAVARRAAGLRDAGAAPHPHDTGHPRLDSATSTACSPRADVVSLHVPLTDATRHLIGAPELGLCARPPCW